MANSTQSTTSLGLSYVPLNITHEIRFDQPPFRTHSWDYSASQYSDILDALAGSSVVFFLTAIIIHFISLWFGFSTNALAVRDLFDGRLLSESWTLFFRRAPNKNEDSLYKERLRLRVTRLLYAVALILALFGAEATIFILQSTTTKSFTLEEMVIPKLKFQQYKGPPKLAKLSSPCFPLVRTKMPLQYLELTACIRQNRQIDTFSNLTNFFSWSVSPVHSLNFLSLSFATGTIINNWFFDIYTGHASHNAVLNETELVPNPLNLSMWLTEHMVNIFNCTGPINLRIPNTSQGSAITGSAALYCSGGPEIDPLMIEVSEHLLLSTFRFSNEILTRRDFNQTLIEHNDFIGNVTYDPIEFDKFVKWRAPRWPGYGIWICSIVLLGINLLLSWTVPDLLFAKALMLKEALSLKDIPIHIRDHFKFC